MSFLDPRVQKEHKLDHAEDVPFKPLFLCVAELAKLSAGPLRCLNVPDILCFNVFYIHI